MRSFTILLAAYDRLPLLQPSLASALAQEWPDYEVLVIDDGSAPPTRDWLDQTAAEQARLRVVHQENAGVAAARAAGVEQAQGEYVVILDSDDRLEPAALQRIDQAFDAEPETDLLYGNIRHVFPDGRSKVRRYKQFASNARMIWGTFFYPRVPFKHSGSAFRRATALELGNYDTSLKIKIDVDFFLRFLAAGKRLNHLDGAPLIAFHVHKESMSRHRGRGIPVWFALVNRYAPRNPLGRLLAKGVRAAAEIMKAVYERLRG